ncbi:MAG TPA: acylphosphatase [Actinomycetes bacterium]|jgi:acylphosphatase|nr:acylphosphatase [Actinomycetes bacterium]
MANTQRLQASIHGRVQGVGFRYSVISAAQELGLRGFVENRRDGSVYVEAEGPPAMLDRLEAFLRRGPRLARVEQFQSKRQGATGEFDRFSWR